jgi:hypothetical protein
MRASRPSSKLRRRDGDDKVVSASAYLSGSAEAGGDDNRRWCDILHARGGLLWMLAPATVVAVGARLAV